MAAPESICLLFLGGLCLKLLDIKPQRYQSFKGLKPNFKIKVEKAHPQPTYVPSNYANSH